MHAILSMRKYLENHLPKKKSEPAKSFPSFGMRSDTSSGATLTVDL